MLALSLLSATLPISRQQQGLAQPYPVFPQASQKDSSMLLSLEKQVILKDLGNASNVAIVVGVITPNGIQVSGYGTISNSNHTSVDGNTIFGIGSVTKTFTATLLAEMLKNGLVSLNDPIAKYLPATVKVPMYNGVQITIGDLATHTSGLPDFPPNFPKGGNYNPNAYTYTPAKLYQGLSNTTLMSQPGSKYSYSDIGYGLLGYILSLRSAIPYEQLVKDRILNVLGMNSTAITLPDALKSRLAIGHLHWVEVNLHVYPEVSKGSGALRSSANDLLRYLAANMGLNQTKLNDVMQQTQIIRHVEVPEIGPEHAYIGLGWNILTNGTEKVIDHPGAVIGYHSFIGFNPAKQVGVVVLCSCDNHDVPKNVINGVPIRFLLSDG
jgi:CubicO group peptidase (beta-lactamase class C family)